MNSNPGPIIVNRRPWPGQTLRLLALHADYACANTGLCCQDAWSIRLHDEEAQRVDAALAENGDGLPPAGTWYEPKPLGEMGDAQMKTGPHGCLFHSGDAGSSSCALHRRFGAEVLPTICQTYPRLALRTPAGIYLTLTNTCPTAAALLRHEGGLREVAPGRVWRGGALGGSIFGNNAQPPRFGAASQPGWEPFDYFWRWSPEWMSNATLTPGEALFGLGLIVGHIEGLGAAATQATTLIDQLDQLTAGFAPQLAGLTARSQPDPLLSATYADVLLNVAGAVQTLPPELAALRPADLASDAQRAALAADYAAQIAPRMAEHAVIERNYIGTRLYANPLAYRASSLRAGYFVVVLMSIGLRYAALGHCRLDGRALDADVLLKAAATIDRLLLHDAAIAGRMLELLEPMLGGDVRNLAQPALM